MSCECERVLDRLSPYLDHELPDADASSVRSHLRACPLCAGAHVRLEKLERISVRLLAEAPEVGDAEWRARWAVIAPRSLGPRAARLGQERVRGAPLALFAAAAALLVAAALAVPLIAERLETRRPAPGLWFSCAPGANKAEVLEIDGDLDRYSIGIDYPRSNSGDPIVIMVSKL